MIKLVRVDHRLLHGQVIFSWTRQMGVDHIIVADDLVPNDPIGKMALSLAKPAGCSLDIIPLSGLKEAADAKADKNVMIIVRGPKEALKLVKALPEVKEVNYGGVAKKQDSKAYGKAVYLNGEELKATQDILAAGVRIYIQQVPASQIEHADFSK